ncbi:malonate decarboxylase subunit gamma [Klebsiella pneumoniae]|uniref:Malonate decarboxylase subunit gamma n=1 Tax=Klebsiella pneumoniae TaxID=573 RepID=A0A2X3CP09_KLEPN|nr:malonate decarboxylase subunit gamma [Klebsiella pneumoniae]
MSQFPNRAALWLNNLAPDVPLMERPVPFRPGGRRPD